jgi:hypothetical protein
MRSVQAIQSFAALCGAIIITFLQPQRDEIGAFVIGTYGLLAVSSIWAISHIVTAAIQKKKRAYISNGIILLAFAAYIFMCVDHLRFHDNGLKAGNFSGNILVSSWLFFGGVAVLAVALAHRKFPKIYKDNLITALIFLIPAAVTIFVPGLDPVSIVGILNASLIFTAVHLGISSASPNGISAASPAAPKTKA